MESHSYHSRSSLLQRLLLVLQVVLAVVVVILAAALVLVVHVARTASGATARNRCELCSTATGGVLPLLRALLLRHSTAATAGTAAAATTTDVHCGLQ
eukprot:1230-Heterococcus_DN1.PRE.1